VVADSHERALGELLIEQRSGEQADSVPFDDGRAQRMGVVDPTEREIPLPAESGHLEPPPPVLGIELVEQAELCQLGEIHGIAQLLTDRRIAHRDQPTVEHLDGVGARPPARAPYDAEVDVVDLEIDRLVGMVEAKIDLGMLVPESAESGGQPPRREVRGNGERDGSRRAAGVVDPLECGCDRFVGVRDGFDEIDRLDGRHRTVPVAIEQRNAEGPLEATDVVAHRRRGDVQLTSGAVEAAMPCDRFERSELRQSRRRHGVAGKANLSHQHEP
jgi:hypothetical protein